MRFLLLVIIVRLHAPIESSAQIGAGATPGPAAQSKRVAKPADSSTNGATEFAQIAGTYTGSIFGPDYPNRDQLIRLAKQHNKRIHITVSVVGSANEPKLDWGKQTSPLQRTGAGTFIFDDRKRKRDGAYGRCIVRGGTMHLDYTAQHYGKLLPTSLVLRKQ